jgi:LuxR family maltose regulon positive regulatory protein
MSGINFQNDKFVPAILPDICAPRHQLLNTYKKAAASRMIYVWGPAGYGKTVSTLLWLVNSDRIPVWIGLDSYDNVPSVFYKLFCTGIFSVQPNNESMERILKDPSFVSSPIENTIHLLSAFKQEKRLYALVFDDMHLINHEEILKSFPLILKRLPHSFVTLVLSRNEPHEQYKELAKKGAAVFITTDNLAFSEDEIRKYLISTGLSVTEKESKAVHLLTDGWPIGINALAMSGRKEFVQNSGESFENYIKEQVWDNWDKELQEFMLKTSVVDEMPPLLACRLTGRDDSGALLENLCAKNSFVIRLGGDVFRYHHLFLNFLRNMERQAEDKNSSALYKIAAEYYLEKNDDFTARRYAIKAKDYQLLMKIMYKMSQYKQISRSIAEYVEFAENYYIGVFPEPVCDERPFLYIYYAYYYYLMGQAEKQAYYNDKIQKTLPVLLEKFPHFAMLAMLASAFDHRASLVEVLEHFSALPHINSNNNNQQGMSLTLHFSNLLRGCRDYSELTIVEITGSKERMIRIILQNDFDIWMNGFESAVLYEQNSLKKSLAAVSRAKSFISDNTAPEITFAVLTQTAAIYFALGKSKEYDALLKETSNFIKKHNAQYLNLNFLAYQSKMKLFAGDQAAARVWLDNYFVTETERLELYKIYQHFTTARAYIVLGQFEKAMNIVLKLKKLGQEYNRFLDVAEATVLQSIIEWTSGRKKEAQNSLETALNDMYKYGYTRVIADEGAAILPVIKKIISRYEKSETINPKTIQFLKELYLAAYGQSKRYKGIIAKISGDLIKLSKRQTLIISLLSQGHTNAQIAETTGLRINTVKAHKAVAYAKLNANNVADAVLRARELGVLDD